MTPYRFSLQKIFKKSNFFKFFCIFRISMTSWLEKWSYFWNLINFQFWPFWHFIDLQLLRPTEALSLSIKFHVSLLSHVVEVKYDCNEVIWPYFQSTPNYVQCAWGWGQGKGVQKNFFDQGGTLLIKVGQYFFTGVVILEKMAPQGGWKNFRPPSAAKNLPPPWALGPTS